jgi:hypothetical protein
MDRFNKFKVKSRFDKKFQIGLDQTMASASVSPTSTILPGSSTTTTKVDDGILPRRQSTQHSDHTTALVSTQPTPLPPPPHSHVTESGASVTTATQSVLALRTPEPTTSQGGSHSAVVTTSSPQTRNQLEIGISAQDASLPHSGFFAGAKGVDASHGIFTDVAGDNVNIDIAGDLVNIKIENQVCCAFEQLNNH